MNEIFRFYSTLSLSLAPRVVVVFEPPHARRLSNSLKLSLFFPSSFERASLLLLFCSERSATNRNEEEKTLLFCGKHRRKKSATRMKKKRKRSHGTKTEQK